MSPSPNPAAAWIRFLHDLLVTIGNHCQSPLLYVCRFVWGIQLMQGGVGKLFHIDLPTGYFQSLGIPFPAENAWLVAFTETFGGIFLALGFLSRLTAIPLIINFIVAYITTEQDGLKDLLIFDTTKIAADTAFPYLMAAVLVFAFGPGAYSLDYLYCRIRKLPWRGPGI